MGQLVTGHLHEAPRTIRIQRAVTHFHVNNRLARHAVVISTLFALSFLSFLFFTYKFSLYQDDLSHLMQMAHPHYIAQPDAHTMPPIQLAASELPPGETAADAERLPDHPALHIPARCYNLPR